MEDALRYNNHFGDELNDASENFSFRLLNFRQFDSTRIESAIIRYHRGENDRKRRENSTVLIERM